MQKVELGLHLLHPNVAVLPRPPDEQLIVELLVGNLVLELLHLFHLLRGRLVLLLDLGLLLAHLVL